MKRVLILEDDMTAACLLERAAKLNDDLGAGSLTALPIIGKSC